ncbi:cytochrome ubiquinol oxidase subunit I [Marinagarivorans cellulosilyticus]|uniref:Cytochrome bd ubiquinol oxidase subunit I n=1 Tax=Marinagarivorans cellulosilyticus TaxID=2721545 RepID=A0AAN1WGN8_9GAMM|nr:cytochrome ubiquinol oxidase subunit I [Marinagarivorans cellulosilyticus]BCD97256.1 cytochrome bd ubiquinol oxidase subunit I [Marinagarivorans cellulosilyticus]
MLDVLMLSRIQFAANISFHILFPTITIALCWYLLYFKIRQHVTPHPVWQRAYRFWVKIFALTFALGVVSGITMSFQFGTNWPGFMEKVGNIAGPLLGYEVLTAFFLEATFLGIMLFGQSRVPPWLHTLATAIVALGTMLSAFWILALNSWMHTPAGFELRDGIAFPTSWWAIIFNPSFPYRFGHMLLASLLTASFLIAGLSAYRLLKGDTKSTPKNTLKHALIVIAIAAPLQLFMGDMHGLNTFEHQPQKVAAMEGVWETTQGAPLLLFALPDENQRTNHFELGIPKIASFILTHDLNGEIKGLNSFEHHPPVAPIFFSFRIMVALGMLMILTGAVASYFLMRKIPWPKWYLRFLTGMTFSGWVATLAGWYVTEIGRQPYLVTGVLTVQEAATTQPAANVGISLAIYLALYAVLLVSYIHTLMRMAKKAVDVPEYESAEIPHAPFHNEKTQPVKAEAL